MNINDVITIRYSLLRFTFISLAFIINAIMSMNGNFDGHYRSVFRWDSFPENSQISSNSRMFRRSDSCAVHCRIHCIFETGKFWKHRSQWPMIILHLQDIITPSSKCWFFLLAILFPCFLFLTIQMCILLCLKFHFKIFFKLHLNKLFEKFLLPWYIFNIM